ncbi:MAG: response regulator [Verrucomicrobia bacterium]|nr:response regulator [Verrucomicrobiota bacterium]
MIAGWSWSREAVKLVNQRHQKQATQRIHHLFLAVEPTPTSLSSLSHSTSDPTERAGPWLQRMDLINQANILQGELSLWFGDERGEWRQYGENATPPATPRLTRFFQETLDGGRVQVLPPDKADAFSLPVVAYPFNFAPNSAPSAMDMEALLVFYDTSGIWQREQSKVLQPIRFTTLCLCLLVFAGWLLLVHLPTQHPGIRSYKRGIEDIFTFLFCAFLTLFIVLTTRKHETHRHMDRFQELASTALSDIHHALETFRNTEWVAITTFIRNQQPLQASGFQAHMRNFASPHMVTTWSWHANDGDTEAPLLFTNDPPLDVDRRGMNPMTDPAHARAMHSTLRNGDPAMAMSLLRPEGNSEEGFTLYQALSPAGENDPTGFLAAEISSRLLAHQMTTRFPKLRGTLKWTFVDGEAFTSSDDLNRVNPHRGATQPYAGVMPVFSFDRLLFVNMQPGEAYPQSPNHILSNTLLGLGILIVGFFCSVVDRKSFHANQLEIRVTERTRELAQTTEAYKSLSENLPVGVALVTPNMRVLSANPKMLEWFPEFEGDEPGIWPPSMRPPPNESGGNHEMDAEVETGTGSKILRIHSRHVRDFPGKPGLFLKMAQDVTEAETAAAQTSTHLRFLHLLTEISADLANLPDEDWHGGINRILKRLGSFFAVDRCCLLRIDPELRHLTNTHEWCAENISSHLHSLQQIPESELPWFFSQMDARKTVHIPSTDNLPVEALLDRAELEREEIQSLLYLPLVDDHHRIAGSLGFDSVRDTRQWSNEEIHMLRILADVVAGSINRKNHLEELARSEAKYRVLVQNALIGVVSLEIIHQEENDPVDFRFISVNPAFERMVKQSASALHGNLASRFLPEFLAPSLLAALRKVMQTGIPQSLEFSPAHGQRHYLLEAYALEEKRIALIFQDITRRKKAEAERLALKDQLLQARKMESVGRLAGGVAHDYNNTLQVILGNAELMLESKILDDEMRLYTREILDSAQRSAKLTRQLLGFARKQTIAPKILDLNQTIRDMLSILTRLLGRDIRLDWQPGSDIWPVFIDPGQLDQVIMNLCVNARDAVGQNGEIILRTENVHLDPAKHTLPPETSPGDYVRLDVSDNGHGIPPELLEVIFEPFVTTKPVGQGTGLGLATVYGILRQNQGFAEVNSESGKGTVFHLYFPAHKQMLDMVKPQSNLRPAHIQGQGETILMVEDEKMILTLTTTLLQKLNYEVLSTEKVEEAIELARTHRDKISVLLTDLVMPVMTGDLVAKEIRQIIPEIKILYMSGHSPDTIRVKEILNHGEQFLQKPFSFEQLATKIHEVLKS